MDLPIVFGQRGNLVGRKSLRSGRFVLRTGAGDLAARKNSFRLVSTSDFVGSDRESIVPPAAEAPHGEPKRFLNIADMPDGGNVVKLQGHTEADGHCGVSWGRRRVDWRGIVASRNSVAAEYASS